MKQELDEVGKILPFDAVSRKKRKFKAKEEVKPEVVFFGFSRAERSFFKSTGDFLQKSLEDVVLSGACGLPANFGSMEFTEHYGRNNKLREARWCFKRNIKGNIYFFSVQNSGKDSAVSLVDKVLFSERRDQLIYLRYKKVEGMRRKHMILKTGLDAVPHVQRMTARLGTR